MNKLQKTIKAIRLIFKNPYLLNNVLNSPDIWKEHVIKNYNLNNGLPLVHSEDLFLNNENCVKPYSFTDGGSLITDILLLKNAAASFNKCLFFEFGTWRGETTANVASVAKKCFTLNLSDEEMKSLHLSQDYINQIGLFSKEKENITHLKGNSLTFNYSELSTKFDLIFIDIDMLSVDDSAVSKVIMHISRAPVVTMTNVRLKDIEFDEAGVAPIGHLKKPISRFELFKISLEILDSKKLKILSDGTLKIK